MILHLTHQVLPTFPIFPYSASTGKQTKHKKQEKQAGRVRLHPTYGTHTKSVQLILAHLDKQPFVNTKMFDFPVLVMHSPARPS